MLEKIFQSVLGTYYTPCKSTVFHADRRNENEHSAADLARRGTRVNYGNETTTQAWSNAVFKNKNSTDPVVCRGCGVGDSVRYAPSYSYVFAVNDAPTFEQLPKGSEKDRSLVLYLPNKYVDHGVNPTSPRTMPKDEKLEEEVASNAFALGHLLNLIQVRLAHSHDPDALDKVVAEGTPTSKYWLRRWEETWAKTAAMEHPPSSARTEDIDLILKLHAHFYDQGKTSVFEGAFRDEPNMPGTRTTRWQDFCAMHERVGTLARILFRRTTGFNRRHKSQGMLVLLRCNYARYSNLFSDEEVFGEIAKYKYTSLVAGEDEAQEIVEEVLAVDIYFLNKHSLGGVA